MVLYMLAVNMEPMVWGELVLELQQILKESNQQCTFFNVNVMKNVLLGWYS
jgi:hypothetical protein